MVKDDRYGLPTLLTNRDHLREDGMMAGIGIAACLEPSGGNSRSSPYLIGRTKLRLGWVLSNKCRWTWNLTARIHTTSSGQGHETLVSTVLGEVLEIDPSSIRITDQTH